MGLALIFPGQGSQYVGMGKALAAAFGCARRVFDEVDDALSEKLSTIAFEGPESDLRLTANAQPALMAVSMAALRALEHETGFDVGRDSAFVAGHSLGEYSALAAAGSLSLADAAKLLRTRGQAMQRAAPSGEGAMAAVIGLSLACAADVARRAAIETGGVCGVANDNGGGQIVLSGSRGAVEKAGELAKAAGAKRAIQLPVSAPFHCALMAPAAQTIAEALEHIQLRKPAAPLVSNVSAQAISDPDEIRRRLVEQATAPVRWAESVAYMREKGVVSFYEMGAGKVLIRLLRRIAPEAKGVAIGEPADIAAVKSMRA